MIAVLAVLAVSMFQPETVLGRKETTVAKVRDGVRKAAGLFVVDLSKGSLSLEPVEPAAIGRHLRKLHDELDRELDASGRGAWSVDEGESVTRLSREFLLTVLWWKDRPPRFAFQHELGPGADFEFDHARDGSLRLEFSLPELETWASLNGDAQGAMVVAGVSRGKAFCGSGSSLAALVKSRPEMVRCLVSDPLEKLGFKVVPGSGDPGVPAPPRRWAKARDADEDVQASPEERAVVRDSARLMDVRLEAGSLKLDAPPVNRELYDRAHPCFERLDRLSNGGRTWVYSGNLVLSGTLPAIHFRLDFWQGVARWRSETRGEARGWLQVDGKGGAFTLTRSLPSKKHWAVLRQETNGKVAWAIRRGDVALQGASRTFEEFVLARPLEASDLLYWDEGALGFEMPVTRAHRFAREAALFPLRDLGAGGRDDVDRRVRDLGAEELPVRGDAEETLAKLLTAHPGLSVRLHRLRAGLSEGEQRLRLGALLSKTPGFPETEALWKASPLERDLRYIAAFLASPDPETAKRSGTRLEELTGRTFASAADLDAWMGEGKLEWNPREERYRR